MKKRDLFIVFVLLSATVANVCNGLFGSSARKCERILEDSKKSFDNQYSLLLSQVASNACMIAQYQAEVLSSPRGTIVSDGVHSSASAPQEKYPETRVLLRDYRYFEVGNEVGIEYGGIAYYVGDWFGDGQIIRITPQNVFLHNGTIYYCKPQAVHTVSQYVASQGAPPVAFNGLGVQK